LPVEFLGFGLKNKPKYTDKEKTPMH
jgi:hypothetical protein